MFVRTENFYTFKRYYPVITTLVIIHLIIFLSFHLLPSVGQYIYQYGVGYNRAISIGEYWRLITPIFMHISFGHFIFNSFSLVIFGPALEQMLGRTKFVILYLFTGIIANIATYFIGGLDYPPHLGASGAIFGLLGVYIFIVIYRKHLIDTANAQLISTLVIFGLVSTFMHSNINVIAHLFGLIAGFALSPFFLANARSYHQVPNEGEVSFNPNRWQKRRTLSARMKYILWIAFAFLIILGIMTRFI